MDPQIKKQPLQVGPTTSSSKSRSRRNMKRKKHNYYYGECRRNHAAALGAHSLDGCLKFIASPSSNPADPSSLTCAACSCHRNFHRPTRNANIINSEDSHDDDDNIGSFSNHNNEEEEEGHRAYEEEEEEDEDDDGDNLRGGGEEEAEADEAAGSHVLLTLKTGGGGGAAAPAVVTTTSTLMHKIQEELATPVNMVVEPGPGAGATNNNDNRMMMMMRKKRYRSKFSKEQKERMMELAERVGWRLQRSVEEVVDEGCRRIGVERSVFKVWMHNNKGGVMEMKRKKKHKTSTTTSTSSKEEDHNNKEEITHGLNGTGSYAVMITDHNHHHD